MLAARPGERIFYLPVFAVEIRRSTAGKGKRAADADGERPAGGVLRQIDSERGRIYRLVLDLRRVRAIPGERSNVE
jgi:hypothetical protein